MRRLSSRGVTWASALALALGLCTTPASAQASAAITIAANSATALNIEVPQGTAHASLQRIADSRVRITVRVPDASVSWRDGITIMIDPVGDATPAPGHDDYQLDFRRVLDSSVVRQAAHGTWMAPANDPDWRLGNARGMETWQVTSSSDAAGWMLTLEIDEAWLAGTPELRARLGFLLHDDDPNRWASWPVVQPATRIEVLPALWSPVLLR